MDKVLLTTYVESLDEKFKYAGISRDNPKIQLDYNKPFGDGEGYTPLELFLISFSTCATSSIALVLRRMNHEVKSLKVNTVGERKVEHPTCFSKIILNIELDTNAEKTDIDKAIKISEEKLCPVWAMIKNNVEVEIEYNLNKTAKTEE